MNEKETIGEAVEIVFAQTSNRNRLMIFDKIMKAYNNAARGHHGVQHIAESLHAAKRHKLSLKKDFVAAILFHDIVYEPDRYAPGYDGPSNEEESARLCCDTLYNAGLKGAVIERTSNLIRMTEKHIVPEKDFEAALFVDIDMSVLGADTDRYKIYAHGKAKEFLQVFTCDQYIAGRTKFLESQSLKETIFLTPQYKALNIPARENMAWEMSNLPALVSTLSLQARP